MIKIIHILEDFSYASGGVRTTVKSLNNKLNENGFISKILSPFYEEGDECVVEFSDQKKNPWNYSKRFIKNLRNLKENDNIDILHIHGAWMHQQYFSAKFAIKNNIPFIITFHGMYEPWLWEQKFLKKKIYSSFLTNTKFSKATAIHAITLSEKKNLKKIFPRTKIFEIPNLIDTSNYKEKELQSTNFKNINKRYILFVGRLHLVKGIDLLLNALSLIQDSNIKLKIAGPKSDYLSELKNKANSLNIEHRVEFLGRVNGKEKNLLYKNSTVFVAPSYSEVIGMVNIEAALQEVPVITTYATGIKKEWSNNGGELINPNTKELVDALDRILNLSDVEREYNGKKLKSFVEKNYSWKSRFNEWNNIYKSLLPK